MKSHLKLFLFVICVAIASAPVLASEKERNKLRKTVKQTLSKLYEVQPSAKSAVEKAAGYAVFNNTGMKILVTGGGRGKGIAVDNSTGKETFMKMVEVQAGLGMGIKKFNVIFVFENSTALNDFVESGWQFGGQATAAAKLEEEGEALAGAVSVSPGVWIYQLTDKGLALELTAKGTKYYKDDDLN